MGRTQQTSHTFDMNEYFSGQRAVIGGRDFEKEEKGQEAQAPSEKLEKKPIRDIRDILRSINGVDLYY